VALTPGTRLGVYEVTSQIGVGGMGEVYCATDTKLKRQVAIKVLPPAPAADADRLARFQLAGRAMAGLRIERVRPLRDLPASVSGPGGQVANLHGRRHERRLVARAA
jgi:serine/threonine protein kinase